MPFILPSGEAIRIDYFNVINGKDIVAEYLYAGKLLVTQTMPKRTASIYASALSGKISASYIVAENELMTFEIMLNEPRLAIHADSFITNIGGTHMEIDYSLKNRTVLSQRTSLATVKALAEEIKKQLSAYPE